NRQQDLGVLGVAHVAELAALLVRHEMVFDATKGDARTARAPQDALNAHIASREEAGPKPRLVLLHHEQHQADLLAGRDSRRHLHADAAITVSGGDGERARLTGAHHSRSGSVLSTEQLVAAGASAVRVTDRTGHDADIDAHVRAK